MNIIKRIKPEFQKSKLGFWIETGSIRWKCHWNVCWFVEHRLCSAEAGKSAIMNAILDCQDLGHPWTQVLWSSSFKQKRHVEFGDQFGLAPNGWSERCFFCWSDSVFIFANPKLYDFCSEPGMLFPCPGPISAVSPKAAGSCGWVPVLEEAAEFEIHQITWWSHFKDIKTNIFDLWAGRSWTILTYIDNMQPKDFEGRSTEMSFQCCAVPF